MSRALTVEFVDGTAHDSSVQDGLYSIKWIGPLPELRVRSWAGVVHIRRNGERWTKCGAGGWSIGDTWTPTEQPVTCRLCLRMQEH